MKSNRFLEITVIAIALLVAAIAITLLCKFIFAAVVFFLPASWLATKVFLTILLFMVAAGAAVSRG